MPYRDALRSQYLAALSMLAEVVRRCPEGLWDDSGYANRTWRVAYHALFYTQFYLARGEEAFVPWEHRRGGHRLEDAPAQAPYTREEILDYVAFCRETVVQRAGTDDPEGPSGFAWLQFSRMEHELYNLRHLQQHTGELCERLGAQGEVEVGWAVRGPA